MVLRLFLNASNIDKVFEQDKEASSQLNDEGDLYFLFKNNVEKVCFLQKNKLKVILSFRERLKVGIKL